jgi:poly(3-hydroxybutyrate) depolymerase
MKNIIRLLICGMLLAVTASLSQVAPIEATPGYSATGVVQSEGGGRLYLNTNPCGTPGNARIVIFHDPYQKTKAGSLDCYPNHFDTVTVKQQ